MERARKRVQCRTPNQNAETRTFMSKSSAHKLAYPAKFAYSCRKHEDFRSWF